MTMRRFACKQRTVVCNVLLPLGKTSVSLNRVLHILRHPYGTKDHIAYDRDRRKKADLITGGRRQWTEKQILKRNLGYRIIT